MAESPEMIAAILTSALLRNSGIKESRLAIDKYLGILETLKSATAAHKAPPPPPAPVEAEPEPATTE
jgi:hypothetical protein